jgi:pterin-4a-carbinolamine dehydratase
LLLRQGMALRPSFFSGSHLVRSFSSSSDCESPPSKKKPVCDPHGQNGQPLQHSEVEDLLNTVHPEWMPNDAHRTIKRVYKCQPPRKESVSPSGHIDTEVFAKPPAFQFLDSCTNLFQNYNHYPYNIRIVPRRHSVEVELKTITLHGLSYNDFLLAMQMDSVHDQMTRRGESHLRQLLNESRQPSKKKPVKK